MAITWRYCKQMNLILTGKYPFAVSNLPGNIENKQQN